MRVDPVSVATTPRRPERLLVVLLGSLLALASPASLGAATPAEARTVPAADAAFLAERAQLRKARREFAEREAGSRQRRAAAAEEGIVALLEAAAASRVPGQDAPLGQLIDGLTRLDAARAEPLRARLAALPPEPATADRAAVRAWESQLAAKRSRLLQPTRATAQRAITLGDAAMAGDLMQEYLCFWPDDPTVRANMGQTRIRGRWYGPRSAALAKQGLDWDERLGWIVAAERERYRDGAYYDLEAKRWTTLDASDAAHAALDKPRVVLTEHLELRGNARLVDLVAVGERLEAFYARIFAAYAPFFAERGQADLRLVLGMAEHPRLVVHVLRTEADYQRTVPGGGGGSAGMFVHGRQPASYFYVGTDDVVYHEFTHQILGVFSGGHARAWVSEGVAVYTQSPVIEGGALILGRLGDNVHIEYHLRQVRAGGAMGLSQLFALESGRQWRAAPDFMAAYGAAGAFVHFCMEADGRARRADFIDFLADDYRDRAKQPVWAYLGTTREALEREFVAWAQGVEGPLPERTARGGGGVGRHAHGEHGEHGGPTARAAERRGEDGPAAGNLFGEEGEAGGLPTPGELFAPEDD